MIVSHRHLPVASILAAAALSACIDVQGSDFPAPVAGSGVQIDATTQTIGVDSRAVPVVPDCAEGSFVRRTATGWECATPSASGGPFGPSDLQVDAVTAAAIAAGAVGTAELADGAVTTAKLAQNAVALAALSPEVREAYLRADDASLLYLQRDASSVAYLAAEGGFARLDDLYALDPANRIINSSFEIGAPTALPTDWEKVGDGTGTIAIATDVAVDGARALSVLDSDLAKTVSVRQVLGSEDDGSIAQWRGLTIVASISARRTAGSLRGQICLVESDTTRTCAALGETNEFTRTSVTHVVTQDATEFSLVLDPGTQPGDSGSYEFDAAMVSASPRALANAPAWRPHPTEQIYPGGVRTESLADGAVTASKINPTGLSADLLDGLDSAKFMRSDRDTATTGRITAAGATFSGAISAANYGAVNGTTANFSANGAFAGNLTSPNATFSTSVTSPAGNFTTSVTSPTGNFATAVNSAAGNFTGTVNASRYTSTTAGITGLLTSGSFQTGAATMTSAQVNGNIALTGNVRADTGFGFKPNPAGGTGDDAVMSFQSYNTATEGSELLLSVTNDPADRIRLSAPGGTFVHCPAGFHTFNRGKVCMEGIGVRGATNMNNAIIVCGSLGGHVCRYDEFQAACQYNGGGTPGQFNALLSYGDGGANLANYNPFNGMNLGWFGDLAGADDAYHTANVAVCSPNAGGAPATFSDNRVYKCCL